MIHTMPRPRPLHLHRETNRHSKTVWYVRLGKGPRIRIKARYGTPEFEQAYRDALKGEVPRDPRQGRARHSGLALRSLPADQRLDQPCNVYPL